MEQMDRVTVTNQIYTYQIMKLKLLFDHTCRDIQNNTIEEFERPAELDLVE